MRNLKAAREKVSPIQQNPPGGCQLVFLKKPLQASREWDGIFKVLKGKNLQPRILYPARLSFRIEGEKKKFSRKQKLKET